ncbi:Uncharacterized protein PBTT_03464 [Plasmodiophora brassicae]
MNGAKLDALIDQDPMMPRGKRQSRQLSAVRSMPALRSSVVDGPAPASGAPPQLQALTATASSGAVKQRPRGRHIGTWDVEELQQQVMEMKKKNTELERCRRQLRAQIQMRDERLAQKDNEIVAILQRSMSSGDPRKAIANSQLLHEKSVTKNVKREMRQLRAVLQERTAELNEIRSQMKTTQLTEVTAQAEEFYKEVQRLRLFNQLGRQANATTKLPILEEVRALRKANEDLTADNAELNNRLTQSEIMADQTRKQERKQYAARIHQLEVDLKKERMMVAEMEKIGELSRAELDKVISHTEGTRTALAESASQLTLMKERVTAAEAESARLNAALLAKDVDHATALEQAARLRESMEGKLGDEIRVLKTTVEQVQAELKASQDAMAIARQAQRDVMGSAEARQVQMQKQVAAMQEKLDQAKAAASQAETDATAEIASLRTKVSQLEERIQQLTTSTPAAPAEAVSSAEAEAALRDAQEKLWKAEKEVTELKYQLARQQQEHKAETVAQQAEQEQQDAMTAELEARLQTEQAQRDEQEKRLANEEEDRRPAAPSATETEADRAAVMFVVEQEDEVRKYKKTREQQDRKLAKAAFAGTTPENAAAPGGGAEPTTAEPSDAKRSSKKSSAAPAEPASPDGPKPRHRKQAAIQGSEDGAAAPASKPKKAPKA